MNTAVIDRVKLAALAVIIATFTFTCPIFESHAADDPLKAFPTRDDPVEARVNRLTEAELQAIKVPEAGDELIFSIAKGPAADTRQPDEAEVEPWVRVFSDGRIDCGSLSGFQVERRQDHLTKPELTWLLHLAVNECKFLSRSTKEVADDYQARGRTLPVKGDRLQYVHFHVALASGSNDLSVPEYALMLRPLRADMGLFPFASLKKYAVFLVSRAFLGDPKSRMALLHQLNSKLHAERLVVPSFRMEHLGAADCPLNHDLSAVFVQEIDLGGAHFKRVTGLVSRKEKGAEPIFSIQSMEYQKYRP
jgi:hypothetical protein